MYGLPKEPGGRNKKSFPKVPGTFGKLFKERKKIWRYTI